MQHRDHHSLTTQSDNGGPTHRQRDAACPHQSPCPPADHVDRAAARTIACHPEQGWSLLCNGVVLFEDTGQVLPDGRIVPPQDRRPKDLPTVA